MGFTIRRATPADAMAAVRVVRAVYDEFGFTWDEADYHADLYDLEGHYLSMGKPFLLAQADQGNGPEIVGTIALDLFDTLPGAVGEVVHYEGRVRAGGADCSMERLYVHPVARRFGIGEALVGAIIDTAKHHGRAAMELWSDKRFVAAHRLYERFGAKVIGDRICHDPDQSPEWGLVLALK